MSLVNELNHKLGINYVEFQVSMLSVTDMHQGVGLYWNQGIGINDCELSGVDIGGLLSVIGIINGIIHLLFFFVLQQEEAILIKIKIY